MQLSFSLPSKPSSTKPKPSNFLEEKPEPKDDKPKPKFVTEFDGSRIESEKPKFVIPKLENSLHRMKKMKNIDFPHSDLQFEVEEYASNTDSDMSYGLNLRKRDDGFEKRTVEDVGQEKPDSIEKVLVQKFKQDMNDLPDDRGMDEFKEVPLEEFGASLLAGYGWSEGKGIGRNAKEDVKVVQYERRAGTEGLGFTPEHRELKKKIPKLREMREEKPHLVAAKAPDERTRNVVSIDEKLVPREPRGVFVGKIVRIINGRHVGMKGKFLEKLSGDGGTSRVILRLLKSEEDVSVGEDEVAELGSVEEERCLKKLKDCTIRSKTHEEKRDYGSRSERRDLKRKYDDGRKGKRMDKSNRGDGRVSEAEHHKSHKSSSEDGHGEDSKGGKISWLTSHIRVKVISKDFKGGRLYLKKGEIMDVVGPLTCDISMDDSKELIQGVSQSILETALPKRGGSVLVLFGRHKGVFGKLVGKDTENGTAMVQDADTHEMLTVSLDQIAEYIGDPSYIRY